MPSLNFQKQFVPLIEVGKKRQTIRPVRRKYPIKVGDKLFLFTGLRTKYCKRINTILTDGNITTHNLKGIVICKSVEEIYIGAEYDNEIPKSIEKIGVWIENKYCFDSNEFAKEDGFKNFTDFINFFKTKYGLPFTGVLIKW